MATTKFGISTDEYDRLVERAERFYKNELEPQLIDEYKGYLVEVDGRTLQYALGLYREADIHRELLEKCDDDPVVFTARVGSETVYEITGATVLYDDVR